MAQEEIITRMMLPVGTLLRGTYRVDGYLASGGFGNTYVATHTEFGERCAIKEFFLKGVSQRDDNSTTVSVSNSLNQTQFDEQKAKFKTEARRLRNLRNPHIVGVSDLFDANGTSYYVMEFIDGESLSDRVKRDGPIGEQLARNILDQVLDALQVVHQQGIWHLDIKPANIMLTRDGTAKLIDFGASKQMKPGGGATTSTALCYTPGYAPREQMEQTSNEDRKKIGPWSDLYALGATLYNIQTGNKPPMPIDIDDDGARAFKFGNNVSQPMQDLIRKLMDNDRRRRPQSVAAVRNLLNGSTAATPATDNATDDVTIATHFTSNPTAETVTSSPSVEEPTPQPRKKSTTPYIIAFVACAVIGLLAAWAIMGNSSGGIKTGEDETGGEVVEKPEEVVPKVKVPKVKVPKVKIRIVTEYTNSLGSYDYDGGQANGKPNGLGKATFTNGDHKGETYEGPFVDGRLEGDNGTYHLHNGDVETGTFKNDRMVKGRYTVKESGCYFVGTFKNGVADKGQWYNPDGSPM